MKHESGDYTTNLKEMRETLSKQFKLVFTNVKSAKGIKSVHTFFETESLQTTEVCKRNFSEKNIEEILSNLNENVA